MSVTVTRSTRPGCVIALTVAAERTMAVASLTANAWEALKAAGDAIAAETADAIDAPTAEPTGDHHP